MSFSGMCWYRLMSAARNEDGWHVWSRKQANARLMRDKASGSNLILAYFSLQCSPTAFDLGTLSDVFSLWSTSVLGPGFLISSRWTEFLSYSSRRVILTHQGLTVSAHESSPSCFSTLIFGKSNVGKKQVAVQATLSRERLAATSERPSANFARASCSRNEADGDHELGKIGRQHLRLSRAVGACEQ